MERIIARRPDIELLSAMQGRLGIDLVRQHRPDVVLLDLHDVRAFFELIDSGLGDLPQDGP